MRKTPLAGAVSFGAGALAILLVLFMLIRTWDSAEQIESCTTVGGECYERGQKQTGRAIAMLNAYQREVVILAAACADRPGIQGEAEIRRCVDRGLAPERVPSRP